MSFTTISVYLFINRVTSFRTRWLPKGSHLFIVKIFYLYNI
nr:MAG TPA: hypothetical protein [Caudoviricetes sp.]